jgi:hypothetical protein
MKRTLLIFLSFILFSKAFGQPPQIEGDLMLCPWTNGTASIVDEQVYDSYQWYYKYWFTSDEFAAIDGANEATFTYDWYTYDQSLFKVVVTLDGETYESNTIQIDSYAWSGFFVATDMDEEVVFDPNTETYQMCMGNSITVSIFSPYTYGIQWYRNGEAIDGENEMSYTITEPGEYYVVAAPEFCPESTSSNETMPIVVSFSPDCELNVEQPQQKAIISLFPNPANTHLWVGFERLAEIQSYRILDATGKVIMNTSLTSVDTTFAIDVSSLSAGFYFLQLQGETVNAVERFIKN